MNKAYDLIAATSMGVRITPMNRQPVGTGGGYIMQATSAESNVLNVSASLGLKTRALTAFVEGSPIAAFIKGELRRRGIDILAKDVPQGGPWGYRHQFNIADSGFGPRGPRVWNDRAGEVGRTLTAADFDWRAVFERDGARMVHLSGLFAALSPETAGLCVTMAEQAHAHGAMVSFDLNYRASFWAGREEELRAAFSRIASLSDILVGNEEDFQLALGLEGPAAGGRDLAGQTERFFEMIDRARAAYPNVRCFATTLREVIDANTHLWGAVMLCDGQRFIAAPREIAVLDRIGGGDGFVGGLLYGFLRGWPPEKCLQFGWACGALAVTMLEDYASPADEEQVMSVWSGNARVKR